MTFQVTKDLTRRGQQFLNGVNLRVFLAEFSILSWAVLLQSSTSAWTHIQPLLDLKTRLRFHPVIEKWKSMSLWKRDSQGQIEIIMAFWGATTLSKMTLSKMTFSMKTLSMTLGTTLKNATFRITTLSLRHSIIFYSCGEWHHVKYPYAEWHSVESLYAECHGTMSDKLILNLVIVKFLQMSLLNNDISTHKRFDQAGRTISKWR